VDCNFPGVNFTNLLSQNANALAVIVFSRSVSPGFNFINVLRAHFLYEILAPRNTKPNVTRGKLLKSCQKDLSMKKARAKH